MISLYNSLELRFFFKLLQWSVVSGRPPLLLIIVAQPLDEASKAVLPKGSSHLDGTTAISDLFKNLKLFYDLKNLTLYDLYDLL